MNIGDRIASLRKQKNISQTELGKTVGVSREIIGRYERNEVIPSVEVAKKIADAFEVSLDYLVGEGLNAAFDKETVKRIEEIDKLDKENKSHVFAMLDAFLLTCSIQHKLAKTKI
jgi:transcriptional regulator with XRE-family HTH domain